MSLFLLIIFLSVKLFDIKDGSLRFSAKSSVICFALVLAPLTNLKIGVRIILDCGTVSTELLVGL